MTRKYVKKIKLENYDLPAIYACQLRAIHYAGTYFELVAVYQASLVVFKKTLPLFQIVTAIREKQAELDRIRENANK